MEPPCIMTRYRVLLGSKPEAICGTCLVVIASRKQPIRFGYKTKGHLDGDRFRANGQILPLSSVPRFVPLQSHDNLAPTQVV